MDDFNPEAADDSRHLVCATLLACHTIWYDNANADAGYSLGRVIVHVRAPDEGGFPFRLFRMFLFAQLHGTPDEYVLRVRQVRIGVTEDGEETQTELRDFGPWEIAIPGENYVECFGMALLQVWFPEPGVYEFQLWVDGFEGPLGRERVEARE